MANAHAISSKALALRLALLGTGSSLIYAVALGRFPLLAIYARPIQNLAKLTGADPTIGAVADPWTGAVMAVAVLLLFVLYGLGAASLARAARDSAGLGAPGAGTRGSVAPPAARSRARPGIVLVGFALLFLAILALVYPTTSVDLYDYIFRGRMQVRYGANTFVSVPIDYTSDPLFWYVAWRRAVTAYGPLWEGLSWLTARLAGEWPGLPGQGPARDAELLRLLLAYKGLAAAGYLLCGAAIWLTLRRTAPRSRWLGLYLWLWNPLVLWESLAAGHNDAWMAALIVLAVGLMHRSDDGRWTMDDGRVQAQSSIVHRLSSHSDRPVGALVILTLGGLVKFLALMFGPLLLCSALRRTPTWPARLRLAVLGGVACATVAVLAYAPYWAGWGTLRNFGDRGTLFTSSWLAVLQAPITLAEVQAIIPAPKLLALIVPAEDAQRLAVAIGLGLLACGVVWSTWQSWHAPDRVAEHAIWLLLWFLFLCNPWFQPWYMLWAVGLLAIQPWRVRVSRALGVLCCTAMLSYLAAVFLLPALGWDGEGAEWNALASALIYGPPLLVWLWSWRPALPTFSMPLAAPAARRAPHSTEEG